MSTTVYDDVFRTMVQKMPRLFIALINEVFSTDYPDDVEFEQLRNEHYEENGKIITDSIFKIRRRIFHIEIQSTEDEKIAIRMIEYDFAIGLEAAQNDGAPYKVELPESCVIYLRNNDKTPDYLDVDVTFDGNILPYRTKVIKVQDYTKDELFKKKLLLLLPFYILRYEKYLNNTRQEAIIREQFLNDYRDIVDQSEGNLGEVDFKKLMQLIITIMEHVFDDKSKLGKEAEKIMGGGKVLDLLPEEVIEERDQLRIEVSALKKDKAKAEKEKQKAEKEIEQYRKLYGPLQKK